LQVEDNVRRLTERIGPERAQRVSGTSRILYVFPNLLLFDIEGLAARQLEPVRPDFTEIRAWELAPAGETAEERELRIKILGSFIGPGGLATPDDVEAYECVQRGVVATAGDPRSHVDWSDISRGMAREAEGQPARNVDEAGIRGFWRHWDDVISGGGA
jgi:p-cumate 2,3-dioxygenase alpha subunit